MLGSLNLKNEKKKKKTSAIIRQKSNDQKCKMSNCVSAVSLNDCKKTIKSFNWFITDADMKHIEDEHSSNV